MELEFDANKDRENIKNHGVSLSLAHEFVWEKAFVWPDTRFGYDELRMNALVPVRGKLYHATFVERGVKTRIISIRKASRRENRNYERNYYNQLWACSDSSH